MIFIVRYPFKSFRSINQLTIHVREFAALDVCLVFQKAKALGVCGYDSTNVKGLSSTRNNGGRCVAKLNFTGGAS
jgi:hypothetical protein